MGFGDRYCCVAGLADRRGRDVLRRVGDAVTRTIEPVAVHGGWRLMRVKTYRDAEGDVDERLTPYEPNDTLYPTPDAARAALGEPTP